MKLRVRIGVLAIAVSLLTGCVGPFAPEPGLRFQAVFTRTNNVFEGSEVRILGVPKGQVMELRPEGTHVVAVLEMAPDVDLPADVRASVAPTSLLGERFIRLDRAYTGGPKLEQGDVIPLERTSVGVDIDEVLASFEKFLEGLDENTLADLVDVLVATLEGQGQGLNQLLDQGAGTVAVLRRSSDDLNTAVSQLAELNTTVATRDQEVGALFDDLSSVMRTIANEGPEIIEGMHQLRRLTNELRPLADEHSDAIVTDLEILATSVSTVERNLKRLGEVMRGGNRLFHGAGRGIDFEHAAIRLDNEAENVPALLNDRLIERLAGVCIRLGIDECSDSEFFKPIQDIITCVPTFQKCISSDTTFGEAFLRSIDMLPKPARKELAREARAHQRRQAAQHDRPRRQRTAKPTEQPTEEPSDNLIDRLPLPDPGLSTQESDPTFSDSLSDWLGGG
jgi:virulence factor Mce-like protein